MSDVKKDQVNDETLEDKLARERKEEAWAQFEKSVLEVAEAFFAMSKEEREAMVEYVQERCDEAEREVTCVDVSYSEETATEFNFCPKCGCKLNEEYNFCPKCGLDLSEAKK